jgi:hypothetical protein
MTSQIEKIARLMGYDHAGVKNISGDLAVTKTKRQINATWFNPLTNKADLMDVECALDNICVTMNFSLVIVEVDTADGSGNCFEAVAKYADHPDKFTARANAVCAVAEQIYDRKHNDQLTD